MASRQIGDKPLPKQMLIQFTAAYMQHYGGDELVDSFIDSGSSFY